MEELCKSIKNSRSHMQAAYNGIFLLVLANTLPKFIFAEGGGA